MRAGCISSSRVFFFLLLTYAGFFQAATWGSACRLDLARALVERGTLRIDDYHENTGDKALLGGHYYSDKAPLPSFLAAPGVALAHAVKRATGWPPTQSQFLTFMGGLAALFATGIVVAAGGTAFFRAALARTQDPSVAWTATILVFLGTTIFPYATLLQGHAAAAAWLVLAFHAWFPADGAPSARRSAAGGAAAACAIATEYLAGPAVAILALGALAAPGRRTHRAGAMAAGALPGLALLGAYHTAAFGGPFKLGYQFVALPFFQQKMSTGILGVNLPDPRIALRLLIEPYRGLFPSSPMLLLAVPGLVLLLQRADRRREAIVALGVFIYYWMLQSGHATWHGGWAVGPRHMIPAIPFLGLGLIAALPSWPRACTLAGILSVALMLAVTAVGPEVPEDIANPYAEHILPHFFDGELSVGEQGFGEMLPARVDPAVPDRWDAFLAGEAIGLRGLFALVPLILVWAALWPWAMRSWYTSSSPERTEPAP